MSPTTKHRARSSRRAAQVVATVRPICEQVATIHGLVVWELDFTRAAGRDTLRVSCDKVGGVGSDELALFTEDLSRELDHAGAVPGAEPYTLDVSSPGAERRLRTPEHFRVCRGRLARLTLSGGRPAVEGTIGDVSESGVEIETDEGMVRVSLDDVSRAQLRIPGRA